MDSPDRSYGLPPLLVLETTMEQKFKLRQVKDMLDKLDGEEIKEVFLALQEQNFVLGNTVANLVKEWGKPQNPPTTGEVASLFGHLFGTKD